VWCARCATECSCLLLCLDNLRQSRVCLLPRAPHAPGSTWRAGAEVLWECVWFVRRLSAAGSLTVIVRDVVLDARLSSRQGDSIRKASGAAPQAHGSVV
jgi:hypothetical protein